MMSVRRLFLNCQVTGNRYRVVRGVTTRPDSVVQHADNEWEAEGHPVFSRAGIGAFFQDRPVLKNPFLEDALLKSYLRRHVPHQVSRPTRTVQIRLSFTRITVTAVSSHVQNIAVTNICVFKGCVVRPVSVRREVVHGGGWVGSGV